MNVISGGLIIDLRGLAIRVIAKGFALKTPLSGNSYPRLDWAHFILNQELHFDNTHLAIKSCSAK
jgi:hypothetical protein